MSRLSMVAGNKMEDLLQAVPGAFEADANMRQILIEQLTPRLFAMIGIVVAACLRCEHFANNLCGPLNREFSAQLARDWRAQSLTAAETAALAFAEKGTLDEASVRKRDIDDLRAAGFSDRDVLLIATSIAYHNYSIRMAAAFGVTPS